MSFRAWLSLATLVFITIIIFFSRQELVHAWQLLEQVNVWILLLLIPVQLLVYYAGGEMIFSYLRQKKAINDVKRLTLARMSLEMNFVNHVLPSGGVSGISYMGWRLGGYGVSPSKSTMAQVVRYAMGFVAFTALLAVAIVIVTIDGSINRWIILVSSALATVMMAAIAGFAYLMSSPKRMTQFAGWTVRTTNKLVRRITFGRRKIVLYNAQVNNFFDEMHKDYLALRSDKKVLLKPFLWGLLMTAADVSLFLITFWALGIVVNPAPILIAYGVAAMAGFFVITPGGAGAYEAIMIAFLAVAGLSQGTAIAGIVLTRVILLLGTIGLGYLFYQHAILKYGKGRRPSIKR
ncbi:MAG TPA: lysylphosphatidylglycerol synthase transmembrane domain-containing protein [Candidatus Saccharimonadales bacterium]|nr:lysylphosphatidylglycerol synthase transmembrane domain-containing protein [Candidatus Saccharimonadales bacterium]